MKEFTAKEKFICAYAKESMLCACEMLNPSIKKDPELLKETRVLSERQSGDQEDLARRINSVIDYLRGETTTITSRWQMEALFLTR
ncbi:hypothetical protein ES703_02972 [subsurface metagenome]